MKNLLIYIGPTKGFAPEHETLTKVQIDNSLELGWKPEDIMLVTDFDWEYRGVKTLVVEGDFGALDGNRSSKILVINKLFSMGKIIDGVTYWFHDHDAFQLEPFKELDFYPEVAAFTTHGYMGTWNAGSFFFNRGAEDLFLDIYESMMKRHTNEQDALTYLWSQGLKSKILNQTYNVGIYRHDIILKSLEWPMLVAHFHPRKPRHLELFRKYLPQRLLDIFNRFGVAGEIGEKIRALKALPFDKTKRYRTWEPYLSKYNCKVVCEIGVRQGFHFEYLIKHQPKEAVAIDCWVDDGVPGRNDSAYNQAGLDRQYEKFKAMVADKPFVKIIRDYSFNAVKQFPDEYFDYIFIDADHTYEGISKDLVDWYPKVKKGGVFCGHDYMYRRTRNLKGEVIRFGVVQAVDEFVKKNNITTFFTLVPNTTWGIIKI